MLIYAVYRKGVYASQRKLQRPKKWSSRHCIRMVVIPIGEEKKLYIAIQQMACGIFLLPI